MCKTGKRNQDKMVRATTMAMLYVNLSLANNKNTAGECMYKVVSSWWHWLPCYSPWHITATNSGHNTNNTGTCIITKYIHKAIFSISLAKSHTYLHTTRKRYIRHNQQTHNKHTYFLFLLQGNSFWDFTKFIKEQSQATIEQAKAETMNTIQWYGQREWPLSPWVGWTLVWVHLFWRHKGKLEVTELNVYTCQDKRLLIKCTSKYITQKWTINTN